MKKLLVIIVAFSIGYGDAVSQNIVDQEQFGNSSARITQASTFSANSVDGVDSNPGSSTAILHVGNFSAGGSSMVPGGEAFTQEGGSEATINQSSTLGLVQFRGEQLRGVGGAGGDHIMHVEQNVSLGAVSGSVYQRGRKHSVRLRQENGFQVAGIVQTQRNATARLLQTGIANHVGIRQQGVNNVVMGLGTPDDGPRSTTYGDFDRLDGRVGSGSVSGNGWYATQSGVNQMEILQSGGHNSLFVEQAGSNTLFLNQANSAYAEIEQRGLSNVVEGNIGVQDPFVSDASKLFVRQFGGLNSLSGWQTAQGSEINVVQIFQFGNYLAGMTPGRLVVAM